MIHEAFGDFVPNEAIEARFQGLFSRRLLDKINPKGALKAYFMAGIAGLEPPEFVIPGPRTAIHIPPGMSRQTHLGQAYNGLAHFEDITDEVRRSSRETIGYVALILDDDRLDPEAAIAQLPTFGFPTRQMFSLEEYTNLSAQAIHDVRTEHTQPEDHPALRAEMIFAQDTAIRALNEVASA